MTGPGWPISSATSARPAATLGHVEVHIERRPVLARLGEPVGVVTAIAGQSHVAVALDALERLLHAV